MKTSIRYFAIFILTCIIASMFNSVPTFAAGAEIESTSMHELDSDYVSNVKDGITDSYGNTYSSNVLKFNTWAEAFVTYDLNGAYDTFKANIVCSTLTGSNAKMNVGIYADGELLYDLKGYTRQKAPEAVSLDVSGVGQLSIKTSSTEGSDCYLYLVNSTFSKSDSVTTYPNRESLSDLVIIDSKSSETSKGLFVDSFGNVHNGRTQFNTWNDAYVLYNLDKKYVSFSGCVVAGARTGSQASMNIKFYLDDVEVYSNENITKNSAQIDFNIDVSNASVLKIVTSRNEGGDVYLYVADGLLKGHEHTLGEWTVEKEATCTEDGQKVQKCTECGEVINTEKVPALGHTANGKWEIVEDATCAKEGKEIQKCSVCGEEAETRAIDKKPHSPSNEWKTVREATCAEEGLQQKICTVCGEVIEEEPLEKSEHVFGPWATISGSIWNNPIVKERTCSVCGEVEHVESYSTSWLKPLIIVLLLILFGGLAVILVTLKMNGLPLEIASVKKLFSKETLSDTDIENLLNKKDDTEHKK